MTQKTTLPWDLEHAMTAFQIDPDWYEHYWLRPEDHSGARAGIFARLAAPFGQSRPTKAPDPLWDVISGLGFGDISRRPDGSIDINYYRQNAAFERQQVRREALVSLAATFTRMRLFVTSKLRSLTKSLSRAEQQLGSSPDRDERSASCAG